MAFDMSGYIDVATRIVEFRDKYPDGSLQQVKYELLEVPIYAKAKEDGDGIKKGDIYQSAVRVYLAYTAAAYRNPDDMKPGIGTAWEPIPGPTPYTRDSEMQNAETAAWGRAIVATLAADTRKGVASRDEMAARKGGW